VRCAPGHCPAERRRTRLTFDIWQAGTAVISSLVKLILLINLDSMIVKCQTGVMSTVCNSPTDGLMQSVVATSFFLVDGWTCVQSVGHFVGFWTTVCKTVRPIGSLHCLSVALVYCSQTVGWIKMPLDTEVGLGSGDIVLDGDPAPPTEKGTAARPHFRPMSIVAKRSPISATAELL